MVYCDPETHPDKLPSMKGFGAEIGVHPKNASFWQRPSLLVLDYLKSWDAVAIGETGGREDMEITGRDKGETHQLQYTGPSSYFAHEGRSRSARRTG